MSSERYIKNSDGLEVSEDGTKVKLDVLRLEEDDHYAVKIMQEFENSPRLQGIPLLIDVDGQIEATKSKFLDEIRKIFATDVQTGLLKRSGVDENGRRYIHRFSFAAAMAALHHQAKYKGSFTDCFGHKLPAWVMSLHPYHIRLLCELSLNNLMPLPEDRPAADQR